MKFGYFCNTTNWTHKPYDKLLDETREITEYCCLLYTSPSPRDPKTSRMPSSA